MTNPCRVLLAADHMLVAEGIRKLLEPTSWLTAVHSWRLRARYNPISPSSTSPFPC